VVTPDFDIVAKKAESTTELCVFSAIGNPLLIAKWDAILPAIYTRVFGPASLQDCQKYVKENGGFS
jgi:hypothetical protein